MMIPRKFEFDDAGYACTRLSGELASYITREDFEDLVDHLALYKNILAGECLKDIATEEDIDIIQVYLGGSDEEIEGNYTTLITKMPIQVKIIIPFPLYDTKTVSSTFPGVSLGHTQTLGATTASCWRPR